MVNETIPVPFVGIRLTTARDLSQGRMPVYHKKQDVQARFSLQENKLLTERKTNSSPAAAKLLTEQKTEPHPPTKI